MKICRTTGDKVHFGVQLKKPLPGTEIYVVPYCMRHMANRDPNMFDYSVRGIFADEGTADDVTCKRCMKRARK